VRGLQLPLSPHEHIRQGSGGSKSEATSYDAPQLLLELGCLSCLGCKLRRAALPLQNRHLPAYQHGARAGPASDLLWAHPHMLVPLSFTKDIYTDSRSLVQLQSASVAASFGLRPAKRYFCSLKEVRAAPALSSWPPQLSCVQQLGRSSCPARSSWVGAAVLRAAAGSEQLFCAQQLGGSNLQAPCPALSAGRLPWAIHWAARASLCSHWACKLRQSV
jgi:hypothetical protein